MKKMVRFQYWPLREAAPYMLIWGVVTGMASFVLWKISPSLLSVQSVVFLAVLVFCVCLGMLLCNRRLLVWFWLRRHKTYKKFRDANPHISYATALKTLIEQRDQIEKAVRVSSTSVFSPRARTQPMAPKVPPVSQKEEKQKPAINWIRVITIGVTVLVGLLTFLELMERFGFLIVMAIVLVGVAGVAFYLAKRAGKKKVSAISKRNAMPGIFGFAGVVVVLVLLAVALTKLPMDSIKTLTSFTKTNPIPQVSAKEPETSRPLTQLDTNSLDELQIRMDTEKAGIGELNSVASSVNGLVKLLNTTTEEMNKNGDIGIDVTPLIVGESPDEGGVLNVYNKIFDWYQSGFTDADGNKVDGSFSVRVDQMMEKGLLDVNQAVNLKMSAQDLFNSADTLARFVYSVRWSGIQKPDWGTALKYQAAYNAYAESYNRTQSDGEKLQTLDLVSALKEASEKGVPVVTATPRTPKMQANAEISVVQKPKLPVAAFTSTVAPTATAVPTKEPAPAELPTEVPTATATEEPLPNWCLPINGNEAGYIGTTDAWYLVHVIPIQPPVIYEMCNNSVARIKWTSQLAKYGAIQWGLTKTWPTNIQPGAPWTPVKSCEDTWCFSAMPFYYQRDSSVAPTPNPAPTLQQAMPEPTRQPTPTSGPVMQVSSCRPSYEPEPISDPWGALHTMFSVRWAYNGRCENKDYIAWQTQSGVFQWAWSAYIPNRLYTIQGYLPLGYNTKWIPAYSCSSTTPDPACFVASPY